MTTLYIIATPIGNLLDITRRAAEVLTSVSYILAEDTRVTRRLLEHLGGSAELVAWHQHSSENEWQKVKKLLEAGHSLAVVTDAGTPGVSDPGGKLVSRVAAELPDVAIVPIPGPSALTAAVSVAGIPMEQFLFLGFLPHKKGRKTRIGEIEKSAYPVVLFESVHRIRKTLGELAAIKKRVILCRELTKKFETVYRGSAAEVLAQLPEAETKGEFVIIAY